MIDYAHPCMMAENALNRLHRSMLEKDYDAAVAAGMEAVMQASLTIAAIKEEQRTSLARRNRQNIHAGEH